MIMSQAPQHPNHIFGSIVENGRLNFSLIILTSGIAESTNSDTVTLTGLIFFYLKRDSLNRRFQLIIISMSRGKAGPLHPWVTLSVDESFCHQISQNQSPIVQY